MISISITGGDMTLEGENSVCFGAQTQISPAFEYRIEAVGGVSEEDATTVGSFPFTEEGQVDFSGMKYAHLYAKELSSPAIVNTADLNIPAGIVGDNYKKDHSVMIEGGTSPYTVSFSPQVKGLSIDAYNYLVYERPGEPVEAQTVTITVTDQYKMTGTATITVGAVEVPRYQVAVNSGQVLNGPGSYKEGDTVEIQSTPSAGTRFDH